MEKRNFWFTFLKLTEFFGFLALVELTSRWYFFARGNEETVVVSICLAVLATFGTILGLIVIGFVCAFLYIALKKLYRFTLSGPVGKIRARTQKLIDNNWRTADKIVEKGLWKTFKDYMCL
jgi:hypothetical protein